MRDIALRLIQHAYRELGVSDPVGEAAAEAALKTFEAGALSRWQHRNCSACTHEMLDCPFLSESNPPVLRIHVTNIVYRDLEVCPELTPK